VSARGSGLYALVRYDKNRYRGIEGFHRAREAVWDAVKKMGLEPDTQCSDIARRRFLAHDPDIWVDETDTARLPEEQTVVPRRGFGFYHLPTCNYFKDRP